MSYRIWGGWGFLYSSFEKLGPAVLNKGPAPAPPEQELRSKLLSKPFTGCRLPKGTSATADPPQIHLFPGALRAAPPGLPPHDPRGSAPSQPQVRDNKKHLLFCMLALTGGRGIPRGLNWGLC